MPASPPSHRVDPGASLPPMPRGRPWCQPVHTSCGYLGNFSALTRGDFQGRFPGCSNVLTRGDSHGAPMCSLGEIPMGLTLFVEYYPHCSSLHALLALQPYCHCLLQLLVPEPPGLSPLLRILVTAPMNNMTTQAAGLSTPHVSPAAAGCWPVVQLGQPPGSLTCVTAPPAEQPPAPPPPPPHASPCLRWPAGGAHTREVQAVRTHTHSHLG